MAHTFVLGESEAKSEPWFSVSLFDYVLQILRPIPTLMMARWIRRALSVTVSIEEAGISYNNKMSMKKPLL